MLTLTHSPFLKALGWSLINSLWQFGILWLLFFLFLHTAKKISPALKHGSALFLMSVGLLWFALGLSAQYFEYSGDIVSTGSAVVFSGFKLYPIIYTGLKTLLEKTLPYFSILYLLAVTGFFVRFIRFFFYSHTIQNRGLSKVKPELRLYVQKLVQQLNIGRRVQVWVSEYVDTPMVIGFVKPLILIPIACVNQLSTKQLEAILLHELAHIRRNDYLVNLYISIIDILFFFNPFAKLFVKSVQQEREKSCDDWVLQYRFDPFQYASALLSLEQHRSQTFSLAIGATGKNKNLLLDRVQRIMGIKKTNPDSGFRMMAYFLTIGLLSFIALVNPANLVVENLEKPYLDTKSTSLQFTSSLERRPVAALMAAPPLNPATTGKRKTKTGTRILTTTESDADKNIDEENSLLSRVSINLADKDETPQLALLQTTVNPNQDFSIKDKDPVPPEPAAAPDVEYPFVPNSSYSFYVTEDSNIIRLKVQKKKEQTATQSQAQAQKAIEKLDWNKIARLQNLSKSAIIKLQKEIKSSINTLNWQEIYKEVADSINKENIQTMRSSLKQEYDKVKTLKNMQQQYESIKTELQQQQEKYKQGVELELQEIEKEVKKKKVIVYI